MESRKVDPDATFKVVATEENKRIRKGRLVSLDDIHPTEKYLKQDTVEYFTCEPGRIFRLMRKPLVSISTDDNFLYCVRDGNNRLYALYTLGVRRVWLVPCLNPLYFCDPAYFTELAQYTQEDGAVATWQDLDQRIVTRDEYDKLLFP